MHRLTMLSGTSCLRWLTLMLVMLGGLAVAATQSSTVAELDVEASEAVHEQAAQPATGWSFAVTDLGDTNTVLLVMLAGVAVLAALRHWHGALTLVLAVAVTQAAVHVGKLAFSRPRPDADYALAEATGFSFPSGHAATSMAAYATLTFIAARACGGPLRVALVMVGGLVVLAVGASRVYLGVHYPTDVVAGWLVGAILVVASWAVVQRLRAARPQPRAA